MGFSGTPKRAQESTLGLLLEADWLEKALGVQDAVKPLIIAEGDHHPASNRTSQVDFSGTHWVELPFQSCRGTGMQANGRRRPNIERLFAARLGNAHMPSGERLQVGTDPLPLMPQRPCTRRS